MRKGQFYFSLCDMIPHISYDAERVRAVFYTVRFSFCCDDCETGMFMGIKEERGIMI